MKPLSWLLISLSTVTLAACNSSSGTSTTQSIGNYIYNLKEEW